MSCHSQPVSWLTLERYHIGELSPVEAKRVEEHLDTCPDCAACAASIEADARVMPPLPDIAVPERRPVFTWPRLVPVGIAAAAVVALMFAIPFITDRPVRDTAPDRIEYKGGELALTIERERNGQIVENPDKFVSGDRFRLRVTVPGTDSVSWNVVVFQGNEAFFPYETGGRLRPGNDQPLPGAFRITGDDATEVCIYTGRAIPNRDTIRERRKAALPDDHVCRRLTAPEEP